MGVMRLQRELLGVTLSLASFNFANGLVGVFIPLLLLTAGAPLWQVPAFYVVYAITKLVVNFPVARFVVQRRGAHVAFAVGFGAAVVELTALQGFVTSTNHWWLLLAAASLALVNACLWLSQHLHISAIIETTTKSSNMATIETVNQALSILAPFLGGLIGATFGPRWLIGFAGFFLVLAFVPLSMMRRLDAGQATGSNPPLRYSITGAPARDVFANVCWNVESATGTLVWPIFLAVEIASYRSIGIISALAGAVAIVSLWIAGHRGDRGQTRRIQKEAAAISSVVNVLRVFASGAIFVTTLSTAYRGSLALGQIAWVSSYYGHAKREGAPWVMAMEIGCDLAYLLLWSSLLVVALAFNAHVMFSVAFLGASVAAWGCLAIRPLPGPLSHNEKAAAAMLSSSKERLPHPAPRRP